MLRKCAFSARGLALSRKRKTVDYLSFTTVAAGFALLAADFSATAGLGHSDAPFLIRINYRV
jgi:hypothetical protein